MKRTAPVFAPCALLIASLQMASAIPAFTPGTTDGPVLDGSANVGMAFTANQDIIVTALGAYDYGADGFSGNPLVGIFDSTGTLVGSVTIPTGTGALLDADGYRYASVPEFTLNSGNDYWLTLAPSSVDPWTVSFSGTTTAPEITKLDYGRYTYSGDGLQFPDLANANYDSYVGPNFQFRLPGDNSNPQGVPDGGSTLALAGLAVGGLVFVRRKLG